MTYYDRYSVLHPKSTRNSLQQSLFLFPLPFRVFR